MTIISNLDPLGVRAALFTPILSLLPQCDHQRLCHELSDADWVRIGIERVLEPRTSGRGFLQKLASRAPANCPENSHFFESLKSNRRLKLCAELNTLLCAQGARQLPDRLAALSALDGFDIHAADGHFHGAAAHDKADEKGTKHATGHLYMRNLRSGMLSHLSTLDHILSKKEHDMHGLKRSTIDSLRQGAPKGRKVLLVYDRAIIDFTQWHKWKQGSGIYVITRTKENLVLSVVGLLHFDCDDPINAGVLADELVAPATGGAVLRRVTFKDILSGEVYEFLTNVLDKNVAPGLIAFLYRSRWGIEKSFDEFKNKLGEQKAWASSGTAKGMQAQFLCLTMNLLTLLEHQLATQEDIRNRPEEQRRAKRLEKDKVQAAKLNTVLPQALLLVRRITQIGVKLIRWVAAHLWLDVPWKEACKALRRLYLAL